jgi:hypothetical protein
MQEIQAVSTLKEEKSKKVMEYYVLLQSHIAEADKCDRGGMLLMLANIEDMTCVLPWIEGKLWREAEGAFTQWTTTTDFRLWYIADWST